MSIQTEVPPPVEDVSALYHRLVNSLRAGVLITMNQRGPFGSHVPFLTGESWPRLYIHVSGLAQHTQNLKQDRRVSLFLAEPDRPEKNPLALQRANLQGVAVPLGPDAEHYRVVQDAYVARFPQSKLMFQFADFQLWELQMTFVHFVAGFGRAYTASSDQPHVWVHQKPEKP